MSTVDMRLIDTPRSKRHKSFVPRLVVTNNLTFIVQVLNLLYMGIRDLIKDCKI